MVRADYRAWVALGVGGLPHTLKGYLTMCAFRALSRSGLDTRRLEAAGLDERHAGTLPERGRRRPEVAPHPVPQRQLTQTGTPESLARLQGICDRAVSASGGEAVYKQSHFERHNRAVCLVESACGHPDAAISFGEVGHVHPSDGSMHLVLSAGDSFEALAKGWGELHGLAGFGGKLPAGYTFVYAPEKEGDFAVVETLLGAAMAHLKHRPAESKQ
ncbi:hypothetical protein DFJ74DRAFT_667769 [Hyaloraphidium curvatum]|nr:hypothetical protein DFJ74DRAFT_667769 [Hyaloraphidium curvatum]